MPQAEYATDYAGNKAKKKKELTEPDIPYQLA
jgi:hypothetical protein